jgi:hypothetical protein
VKILENYLAIKSEIEIIESNIAYYEKLLQQEDLSELEYYRHAHFFGIRDVSIVYSEVENQVLKRETAHKLNYQIIRELLAKAKTKLLERRNQIDNVDKAINSLKIQDRFIIRCKYFYSMTYKDIAENYSRKFKYHLTEQTLAKRVKCSVERIKYRINPIYDTSVMDINFNYLK